MIPREAGWYWYEYAGITEIAEVYQDTWRDKGLHARDTHGHDFPLSASKFYVGRWLSRIPMPAATDTEERKEDDGE